jgi:hypothetical protein
MGDNVSNPLDQARVGRILPERDMSPHLIIIGGVFHKDALKVLRVERHQMIRALAPNRSDQAFSMSIPPRRAIRGRLVPDSHGTHSSLEGAAICSVVVADQIFGRRVPGKCLGDLARQPLRRRVLSHRKSQQPPPSMAKNETYEEPPNGNRRDDKQINGCNLLPMIAKETLPALQRPALSRQYVDRHRGLRDSEAQFERFAVDPRSSPQRFSMLILRIRSRTSLPIRGRPPRRRDFQLQYGAKPNRCQRTTVSGLTIIMASRMRGKRR